jgi:hypothetical protein
MRYAGSRVKREIAVPCANHEGIWAPHILHINIRRVNDEIHVPDALKPRKEVPIHIKHEAEWNLETVGTLSRRHKCLAPSTDLSLITMCTVLSPFNSLYEFKSFIYSSLRLNILLAIL